MGKGDRPLRYSWIHSVLEDSDLPPTTRHVLHLLAYHMSNAGDTSYPNIETIAKETGYSKRVVILHLKNAEKAGWIRISRSGRSGQRWRHNKYHATWPKRGDFASPPSEHEQAAHSAGEGHQKGGDLGSPPPVESGSPEPIGQTPCEDACPPKAGRNNKGGDSALPRRGGKGGDPALNSPKTREGGDPESPPSPGSGSKVVTLSEEGGDSKGQKVVTQGNTNSTGNSTKNNTHTAQPQPKVFGSASTDPAQDGGSAPLTCVILGDDFEDILDDDRAAQAICQHYHRAAKKIDDNRLARNAAVAVQRLLGTGEATYRTLVQATANYGAHCERIDRPERFRKNVAIFFSSDAACWRRFAGGIPETQAAGGGRLSSDDVDALVNKIKGKSEVAV